MNKPIIFFAALSFAFLTSCGSSEKQAGEEYYDADYRAKADSAYEENQKNQAALPAQTATATNGNQDTNNEKLGTTASTHSAASEAPSAEADKSQASSPAKTAGAAPTQEKPAEAAAKPAATPTAKVGNFEKGKELIGKSDCLACHKVDQKLVGPAYQDVAKKYEANSTNINSLANKIIKGGAGAWGDIPMSPHPTLSQSDAKEMVQYILSLR